MTAQPTASIIICTLNRAGRLADALRSIQADSSVVTREVVVIDNGSTDDTRAIVEGVGAEAKIPVRYLREETRGKSSALNTGVAASTGSILLFTDDDVIVQDGWADALTGAITEKIGVVGGRVLPQWPRDPPPWMGRATIDDLGVRDHGEAPRRLEPRGVIGANMAIARSMFGGHAAPFDLVLGPNGRLKMDYEEFVLISEMARVTEIAYAPDAVVLHLIDGRRLEWPWIRRMYFQRGFGHARHLERIGADMLGAPTRTYFAIRMYGGANRRRLVNAWRRRRGSVTVAQADEEFMKYLQTGWMIASLLSRYPRLSRWVAAHLA